MHTLAHRIVAGRLTPDVIEAEVARRWSRGDFLLHLGAEAVPAAATPTGRPARYGSSDVLHTEVVDPAGDGVGCIVIATPPQADCDETLRSFLVPPHRHSSAHVALVLDGEARFVVARDTPRGTVAIVEPVSAGTLIFCPAEAPHTFMGTEAFVVASAHARPLAPDHPGFSRPVALDFHALPRTAYEAPRPATPA